MLGIAAPTVNTHGALSRRPLIWRLCLVPIAVLICYQFDWWFLRLATIEAMAATSAVLNWPLRNIGGDLLDMNGVITRFTVGCTLVDYYAGALPLLWDRSRSIVNNLARFVALFILFFAFNIARQDLTILLRAHGLPWWLAHEVPASVTDFTIVVLVIRHRAWVHYGQQEHNP